MITCEQCNGACCRVMAVEIKKPKTKKQYEDIKWYLYHKECFVYVDIDNTWLLQINRACEKLDPKTGKCTIYETRPPVCRDYEVKDCFMNQKEMKYIFMSEESYLKFLKENVPMFKNLEIPLKKEEPKIEHK